MGGSGGDADAPLVVVVDDNHHLCGKEYVVSTVTGKVVVTVYGDQDKPGLITYPDLGVNYLSCFRGLFSSHEAASLLCHNFCVYHIHPPGHEVGAAAINREAPVLTVGALADQILEVLNYFKLDQVMCLGQTAGAYILSLFAMKYKDRVLGLILISPVCRSASWPEWFYNKLTSHILHYSGMSTIVKDILIKRYFSKDARGNAEGPELGTVGDCRRMLGEKDATNIWRYLHAIDRRHDLTRGLKGLTRPTLIFVGDHSPFVSDAHHMARKLGKKLCTLVEVQACGSMVSEEQELAMQVPLENFLMRYGMYRPSLFSHSPRSVLNTCCISPELLSPQSMGLKLKPIRTRSL
ncbi:hypothetical protein MLD38_015356 [Melastoma candidum]|uniref:Uncharacterized protein n=1 Tax=Melastoma candidum TaxID=119954 RepID=A0ACB9RK10_9MYRT|nr:hypothetical protein MLD38_015356 [Melastoma candidum]